MAELQSMKSAPKAVSPCRRRPLSRYALSLVFAFIVLSSGTLLYAQRLVGLPGQDSAFEQRAPSRFWYGRISSLLNEMAGLWMRMKERSRSFRHMMFVPAPAASAICKRSRCTSTRLEERVSSPESSVAAPRIDAAVWPNAGVRCHKGNSRIVTGEAYGTVGSG